MGGDLGSSTVGSFAPHTAGTVFDITKEIDALAVLKAIHRSQIDVGTKNTLRDAVFDYRQNLDQATLTNACELFAQVGIIVIGCTPDSVPATETVLPATQTPSASEERPPVSKLRIGRPRPTFGVSTTPVVATQKPVERASTEPMTPTASYEASAPVAPQVAVPRENEAMVAEAVIEGPAEPVVTAEPTAQPISVPTTSTALPVKAVDRINEIKKLVNEKIGNPVNLIEAHNELGREYMNALLEAMKKSNGGQASELAAAMERLEKAFALVEATLDKSVHVETTPVVHVPIEPVVTPEPVVEEPPVSVQVETVQETVTPLSPPPEPKEEVPVSTPVVAPVITSVAKTKQVEELMHKQMIESSEKAEIAERIAEEKMDPVMVSEVTSGLRQLLSEWSLFKSSGIFGTGPSGIDHALYKKLSSLPMQAVIAGRFEGSTPQIRQSISDYMNGWRYEEGVVFDYGESFEHYLRRVIRHILDKKAQQANPLLTKKL